MERYDGYVRFDVHTSTYFYVLFDTRREIGADDIVEIVSGSVDKSREDMRDLLTGSLRWWNGTFADAPEHQFEYYGRADDRWKER